MLRDKNGLTEEEFLKKYKPGDYERPSVTVDMMIVGLNKDYSSLKLLLIQRGEHPYMNCWALPGGFVNMTESAYQAANRELEEETGLNGVYMEQLYTMSQPDRDPRMRVIDIAYIALTKVTSVKAGDDAKKAVWCDVRLSDDKMTIENEDCGIFIQYKLKKKEFKNGVLTTVNYVPELVSKDALAFDHAEIILEGLMRLRNKVSYTDVAFNLVEKEFTLSDLQRVYELILGKELYKKTFRDKITEKIESLGKKGKSIVGNKNSELFRYKGVNVL